MPLFRLSRDDRFNSPPSVIQGAIPEKDEAEKDKLFPSQLEADIAALKLACLPTVGSQASPSTAG